MNNLSPTRQILVDPTTEWVKDYKKDYEDITSAQEFKEYGGTVFTPIQTHVREREVRGFSRFDWWNFNSYLLWMIAKISNETVEGNISVSDDVRNEAQTVLDHLANGAAHNQKSDEAMNIMYPEDGSLKVEEIIDDALSAAPSSPDLWNIVQEHEKREHEEQQEAVNVFFNNVFPRLPGSADRYYSVPLGNVGNRAQDGYAIEDLDVVRSYLSAIIVSGLQQFAGPTAMGFFGNSLEEWNSKLHKMITAFQLLLIEEGMDHLENPDSEKEWQVENSNNYREGINLFIENFAALWD